MYSIESGTKCADIYRLYFEDFWENLKKKTGCANGFTGLSEVIVFTILKDLIEREHGEFNSDPEKYTNETYYLYNQKFAIGRGLSVYAGKGKRRTPDIVIWKNPSGDLKKKTPDCAIEIKIYATGGVKTVKEAINRLRELRKALKTFKGMIIFYHPPPREGKELLERIKNEEGWLDYVILKDNDENLVERLKNTLRYS